MMEEQRVRGSKVTSRISLSDLTDVGESLRTSRES